jgi:hypothetical protein
LPATPLIRPLLFTISGPPLVVVKEPCRKKLFPVTLIPAGAFVLKLPIKLNVPVQEVKRIEELVISVTFAFVAEVNVTAPRRVVPPRAPERVIFPVPAIMVRGCAPFTVLLKVIFPAPAPVERVTGAVKVKALAKERLAFEVVTLAPIETAPPPDWLKAPEEEIAIPPFNVKAPLLTIATGPLFVVVMFPVIAKAVPVKLTPPIALVFSAPLIEVVPVPADWVMEAAVMACVDTLRALATVKDPRRELAPALPCKERSLVPGVKEILPGPFRVLKRVIALFVELREAVPMTETASRNWIVPAVVMLLERETLPPPLSVNALEMFAVAAELKVAAAEWTIETGPLFVVVIAPPNENAEPVKEIPPTAVVLSTPKVLVPRPAN